VRIDREEMAWLQADGQRVDARFHECMKARLREWFDLAAERLRDREVSAYIIPGNDNPYAIDEVLMHDDFVQCVEERVVSSNDSIEVVGFGGSNRTPWHSPREFDESEIKSRIAGLLSQCRDPASTIWNVHVPPKGTGLDICPAVTEDLRVVYDGAHPRMISVGSTAVRELIEEYQPILGLHGHVHESRSFMTIGRSTVVNPGSEYGEGVLRAAFIQIKGNKTMVQLMAG
jgi:Icc-related predicted phosphoesterase